MTASGSSDLLLRLQNEILEAIACGQRLRVIADLLCRRAESFIPSVHCSILSVDEQGVLHSLAAPSLPAHYSQALEGIVIGPSVGSCGTAAYRGEAVNVTDIATDPLWAQYRELALPIGLKACWSSPIKASDGRVVGTFAFYYQSNRGPSDLELQIVQTCVHLCAIAIESEEKKTRIHQLAYYDALTGLPNRLHFQRRATEIFKAKHEDEPVNIHYIDLDDFKSVNDTLGHRVGDLLLEGVAQRFMACMTDGAFVARLGGDEFAIVQPAIDGPSDADTLARRMIAALDAPFEIDDEKVTIGASIGIAQNPSDGLNLPELAKRADMALYRAKNEGRKTYRFFASDMESGVQIRRGLKQDLRSALENEEFSLVYQPIIDLETHELTAFEALLRWRHPTRGMVSPAEFIPVAEEMGLIVPIGDWVLREACRQAALWPNDTKIAVNLSPLQLKKPGLALDVVSVLGQSGLLPSRLDLEITESALLAEDASTRFALNELHGIGIGISLDDFGTGYSSLRYLRLFPLDKIKIDMSFVRDLGRNADSTSIVRAVIGLARDLGMKTTAEGIETRDQLQWLSSYGCTEGQGYYFSRPKSLADVQAFFEERANVARVA